MTEHPLTRPELPRTREEVLSMVRVIGSAAEPHAVRHDREGSFVIEGYEAIRAAGYGAIAVPGSLGGGDHDLDAVCRAQAELAGFCANTALAIAMHQHNVLSLAWRWRMGDPGVEHTLRRVADEGLILSSSGAADRNNPGVNAIPTDGGLRVTGHKRFVSGVPGSDVVSTLAMVDDGEETWLTTVLVPTSEPGVEIIPEWDALGMRGSGSNPVAFTDVFVPEANILELGYLRRPERPSRRSGGGRVRHDSSRIPGLHVALTVIAATYLGAAEAVKDRALSITAAGSWEDDPVKQRLAGLMTHEVRSGWWALDALLAATTDDSLGTERQFVATMLAKRQVILSSIRTAELAMDLLGSQSYLRNMPFEQALRDLRAGITHPLAPERTLIEVGFSELASLAED